jgi:hypothetical protein
VCHSSGAESRLGKGGPASAPISQGHRFELGEVQLARRGRNGEDGSGGRHKGTAAAAAAAAAATVMPRVGPWLRGMPTLQAILHAAGMRINHASVICLW